MQHLWFGMRIQTATGHLRVDSVYGTSKIMGTNKRIGAQFKTSRHIEHMDFCIYDHKDRLILNYHVTCKIITNHIFE